MLLVNQDREKDGVLSENIKELDNSTTGLNSAMKTEQMNRDKCK